MIGLCVQASATREYYLVGLRHVYMFDVWPDTYKPDRQAIEEDYSGALAAAQQQYDADMASIRDEEAKDGGNIHQADRDAVQQNLEQDISDAADTRDASLSQLYVECDYVRAAHPEFQVDQDGPYQVMGCDVGPDGDFIDICFFRPYKTYLVACPFGWTYGHPYPFFSFGMQIRMAHANWQMFGSPPFAPIFHGGVQVAIMAPVRLDVITSRKSWAGGRPPAITENDRTLQAKSRDLQRKAGIRPPSAHPGVKRVRKISPAGVVSKYSKPPSTVRPTAPSPSRYSHTGTRPAAGSSSSGGSRTRAGSGAGTSGRGNGGGGDRGNGGDKKKGG